MLADLALNKAQQIPGWMSEAELRWLAAHARLSDVIIEFGCYLGRSTRVLGDNTNGVVYAVDPWDGDYRNDDGSKAEWINTEVFDVFKFNLADLITAGKVIPIKEYSWGFEPPQKADLIFIDGDHRYESVLDDIKHALRYIKTGGIVAGHDYGHGTWPGVKKAVDSLFGNVKFCQSIWSVTIW